MTISPALPLLYGSKTSPFGRMTRLYGNLLEIDFTYEDIDIYNAKFLDQHNPLRQIPTLIVGDDAIFDSRTIAQYFESLTDRNIDRTDIQQATRMSLALGMTDACLQYRMEMSLPEGERNQARITKLTARMNRSVAKLEACSDLIAAGDVRHEQIVVACALEYLDFRYTRDWRATCPKLDAWMGVFSERSDMMATRPNS